MLLKRRLDEEVPLCANVAEVARMLKPRDGDH
jgi:hypothetical protein